MSDPYRAEDVASDHVRTPRFFETDKGWFLRTREGIAVGPYRTKFDAEISSSLLSARLAQLDDASKAIATIHAFIRDPAYGPPNQTLDAKEIDSSNGEVEGKVEKLESKPEKEGVASKPANARKTKHVHEIRAKLPKSDVKHRPLSLRLRSLLPGTSSVR